MDFFRTISKGAKFDLNRFSADANRFHLKNEKSDKIVESGPTDAEEIRKAHQIHIFGHDVPNPISEFSDLTFRRFPQQILDNLTTLGFVTPTPIQMQAIPVQMEGRNLLGCAPTGSGKTLSFVLPILAALKQHKTGGPRALILVPTWELAIQIFGDIKGVSNGISLRTLVATKNATSKRISNSDILVGTPNKILYQFVDLSKILFLVADESDKLFQTGKGGFRDQFGEVFSLCTNSLLKKCFYSATFDKEVEEWCRLNLDDVIIMHVGERNSAANTVDHKLLYVSDDIGKLFAIRSHIKSGIKTPALFFVSSKVRAESLLNELIYDGLSMDVLHAGRAKNEAVFSFMAERRSGREISDGEYRRAHFYRLGRTWDGL